MDRITLDKLKLIEQIEYFNNQLKEGMSLTKICDDIGITRKAIRVRFEKGGYVFNKDLNLYEEDILKEGDADKQTPPPNKKSPKVKQENEDTNGLEYRVKALEQQLEDLKQIVYNTSSNTTNTVNTNDMELELLDFDCDTVTRAYRMYEDVQKDFKMFCKKHSEHKVQDIISTALVEFMNKRK